MLSPKCNYYKIRGFVSYMTEFGLYFLLWLWNWQVILWTFAQINITPHWDICKSYIRGHLFGNVLGMCCLINVRPGSHCSRALRVAVCIVSTVTVINSIKYGPIAGYKAKTECTILTRMKYNNHPVGMRLICIHPCLFAWVFQPWRNMQREHSSPWHTRIYLIKAIKMHEELLQLQ